VFVHEYGHYVTARAWEVKAESFSIGTGPAIFGFNGKSVTRWDLCAVLLGGYVKMKSDTSAASVPADKRESTEEENLCWIHVMQNCGKWQHRGPCLLTQWGKTSRLSGFQRHSRRGSEDKTLPMSAAQIRLSSPWYTSHFPGWPIPAPVTTVGLQFL
jgi:membrane-associated protease RseP (regulator of RpoE activity)